MDNRIPLVTPKDMENHIDLNEVLDLLKISKAYFYKLIQEQRMPAPKKIGRRSFWYPSEVKTAFDNLITTHNND